MTTEIKGKTKIGTSKSSASSIKNQKKSESQDPNIIDNRPGSKAQKNLQMMMKPTSPPFQPPQKGEHPGDNFADNRPESKRQKSLQTMMNRHSTTSKPGKNSSIIQKHRKGDKIGAEFTGMPGDEVISGSGDEMSEYISMMAEFDPDETYNKGWGEYRQYVKGKFWSSKYGKINHKMADKSLEEDTYNEDSNSKGEKYGHRNEIWDYNKYEDVPDAGSKYDGMDNVGFNKIEKGERITIDLTFKGALIDTNAESSPIEERTWKMTGDYTRPGDQSKGSAEEESGGDSKKEKGGVK